MTREYYINDAGNQINLLAESIFARYQQKFNKDFSMPEESYKGEDIIWAAEQFFNKYADKFKNKELKGEILDIFKNEGVELFLGEIKKDLSNFNVFFDKYFSEKSLYLNNSKIIYDVINKLENTFQKRWRHLT